AAIVDRGPREQAIARAARKIERASIAAHAEHVEKALRLTRDAAAQADVVPLAWPHDSVRRAVRDEGACRLVRPRQPQRIAGDLVQAKERARGADRAVTPAEIV